MEKLPTSPFSIIMQKYDRTMRLETYSILFNNISLQYKLY